MSEDFKWGVSPEQDCAELKRREEAGIYPEGHHQEMCSVCGDALPVSNFVVPVDPPEMTPPLPPREENTD